MAIRRTVSYFDNQFHSTATTSPSLFYERYGAGHMADIAQRGFNEVVLCVTELDMITDERCKLIARLTGAARREGLTVTADPWRVGGIFGGEGISIHEQNGGSRDPLDPKLRKLLFDWIDVVAGAGITRVFWDEPELSGPNTSDSLKLIDDLSQRAVTRGITWNGSCVRSRDLGIDMSDAVASLSAINEIAVAPYPFHPENKTPKSALEVVSAIAPWFEKIKAAADTHNIEAQAWLQGFNISPENMPILEKYLAEAKRAGIGNIAVWGYNSCAIVTDLNPPPAEDPEIVWKEICRLFKTV